MPLFQDLLLVILFYNNLQLYDYLLLYGILKLLSFEGWIIRNVKSVPSGSPGSDLILVTDVGRLFAATVIQKARSLSTRKGRFAGNAKVPTIKSSLISLEFFGPKN